MATSLTKRARRRSPRQAWIVMLAVIAALLGGYLYALVSSSRKAPPTASFARLVTPQGQPFVEQRASRGYKLLVFGYTHCPDVCPASLIKLHEVLRELGPDGDRLAAVFVTVDPEHDTPDLLASYTAAFDRRIIAVTGAAVDLRAFESVYAPVPAQKPDEKGAPAHSAMIYLLDANNAMLGVYPLSDAARVIAQSVRLRTHDLAPGSGGVSDGGAA